MCDILFGIPTNHYSDPRLLDFLILIGKCYINQNKTKQTPIIIFHRISCHSKGQSKYPIIPQAEGLEVDSWLETLHDEL